MRKKTTEKLLEEDKLDGNVQMCRRIREERDKRFGTIRALGAHLQKLDDARVKREARTRASKAKRRKQSREKPPRAGVASK